MTTPLPTIVDGVPKAHVPEFAEGGYPTCGKRVCPYFREVNSIGSLFLECDHPRGGDLEVSETCDPEIYAMAARLAAFESLTTCPVDGSRKFSTWCPACASERDVEFADKEPAP